MKKQTVAVLLASILSVATLTACSGGTNTNESTQSTQTVSSSVEGTVDEIKDFMFTIETGNGVAYSFPIDEEHPVDLSGISAGDKVKVSYNGELSEVDAFTGEVLSVEKVK